MMLLYVVLLVVTAIVGWILFTPLNIIRKLEEVGYNSLNKNKREYVNEVRNRRKIGHIPPVYPNGWFSIVESDKINLGQSKSIHALGNTFAVFRGESGRVYVLDAFCPHLGADLGIGGRITKDCLECPFHGWKFSGKTGECTHIPYENKVPLVARVKSWPVKEAFGYIFIWFHAEDTKPLWELPDIPEISNGQWVYRGRTEHHINAHIQEIPENGADQPHLAQIHNPLILGGSDLTSMWRARVFGHHVWEAAWYMNKEEEHRAAIHLKHGIVLFDRFKLTPFSLDIIGNQIGPAVVYLYTETWLGRAVFIMAVTPLDGLLQRVVHRLYTQPSVVQPFASLVVLGEQWHFERDIMVWNHKMYQRNPVLTQKDQQIKKFRKWYSQFYSANSPMLTFKTNNYDW